MILVTGANGFVGRALCDSLVRQHYAVRIATRTMSRHPPAHTETIVVGDICFNTDWAVALRNVEVVIHLAARTHVLRERVADPLAEYRRINVAGTTQLATQAANAGIKRFVFLSSVKVNGERTEQNQPYTEDSAPCPEDAYGISKLEAELALRDIAAHSDMEVVIVRVPLIYGAGVKGNFFTLLQAVARGVPLPFASIHNQRSLLNVENLADALITCATHPAAANQTYLVADDTSIATPDLVRAIGVALNKPARLLPCPPSLLSVAGILTRRSSAIKRLTGSLQIDSAKIRRELGWQPRIPLSQGLADTAQWYHARTLHSSAK